jgi:hypothetical protein
MTHGYPRASRSHRSLRSLWIGVIALADTSWYRLRPASPARLGPVRPRAHAAAESVIYRLEDEQLDPDLGLEQHLRGEGDNAAAHDPLDRVPKIVAHGVVDGDASGPNPLTLSRSEQGSLDRREQITHYAEDHVAGQIGLRARGPLAVVLAVQAHDGVGHLGE